VPPAWDWRETRVWAGLDCIHQSGSMEWYFEWESLRKEQNWAFEHRVLDAIINGLVEETPRCNSFVSGKVLSFISENSLLRVKSVGLISSKIHTLAC
jgi:hypothetical protein